MESRLSLIFLGLSLAKINGFDNFEEMLENTFTVIYDDGVCWNATVTQKGWLGWVTVSLYASKLETYANQINKTINDMLSKDTYYKIGNYLSSNKNKI